MQCPIIAIDGPAGAGKTAAGRRVAERLGWTFLDTGVLYRALTWLAARRSLDSSDESALAALAAALDVRVAPPSVADGRDADVYLDGADVTWEIRSPAVDRQVSPVAALPAVRAALIEPQRRAVAGRPAVVVGRDIGTVIFPQAALKIYLDASAAERARRRAAQLAGTGADADQQRVLAEILRRDALDSQRSSAPLVAAPDAVPVCTDKLTVDEVVARVLALWRERSAGEGR